MRHEEVIALVAVILTLAIPIVWIVFHYVYAMTRTVHQAGLKREMVARGYSAQEIIAVVAAEPGRKPSDTWHGSPPAKPAKPSLQSS